MTRKDYVLIAEALKEARGFDAYDIEKRDSGIDDAAQALADALGRDNPRFDRERFLKACGGY